MSATTEYVSEVQFKGKMAKAFDLDCDYLEQFSYEVEEREGGVNVIIWLDDAPEEVISHMENGRLVTYFSFEPEPDWSDYE